MTKCIERSRGCSRWRIRENFELDSEIIPRGEILSRLPSPLKRPEYGFLISRDILIVRVPEQENLQRGGCGHKILKR